MKPRVESYFTECVIKSQPSDLINEIDGHKIFTCIDGN